MKLILAITGCFLAVLLALETGCGGGSDYVGPDDMEDSGQDVPPVTTGNWYRPHVGSTWQWQLSGVINTAYNVNVYDIDLFDASTTLIEEIHAEERKVVCYFSAGSYEDFRPDSNRFQPGELGNGVEGYSDERWLDIRSVNVLDIMRSRLDLAVSKGCDGVEPDNVDGFANNTGFPLTPSDQLIYNRRIANEAHIRGLGVALKNDLDQISELLSYFDFTVNEQCHEYHECELLQPFVAAGKPVFNAEYAERYVFGPLDRQALCAAARTANLHTLVLPVDLDDTFRFSCDPE